MRRSLDAAMRLGSRLLNFLYVTRAAAILLALLLAGCATAPRPVVPKEVKVPVYVYVEIPKDLTEECVVAPRRDDTVGEALRVASDRKACNIKDTADKRAIRKISDTAVSRNK